MLEKKGKALKRILRCIPTKKFICEMVNEMLVIYNYKGEVLGTYGNFIGEINIGSKKKVYKYLLGLLMCAEYKDTKNAEKLLLKKANKIKEYVEEIISYYLIEFRKKVLKNKSLKEEIALKAFVSYFDFDIFKV